MKHVVCYSGGHSSALVAIEVATRFDTDDLILLNHDIIETSEDIDIKRFKREVAAYLGVDITYANMPDWDKKDQFDVAMEARAFKVGNGTALCTNRLKTQPFESWLKENCQDKDAIIYYGFDRHETGRIQRRSSYLAVFGYRTDYPLALWKRRTIYTTRDIGIEPPNTYSRFKHANCVGCLKAGMQHWYVVYCTRPDIWEKAKLSEEVIDYSIIKGVYLSDLEPLFEKMAAAGIEPTEHVSSGKFWSNVRSVLQIDVQDDAILPCECVV